MAERVQPQLPSPNLSSDSLTVKQMCDLAGGLRGKGWLTTTNRLNIQEILQKWGHQGDLTSAEAKDFFKGKLTPEGEKNFNLLLQTGNSLSRVDPDLAKSLQEGPSSLIAGAVADQLARSVGSTPDKKVPLKAWVLNPGAAVEVARAMSSEAGSRAETRKTISETASWVAGVAANDTRRDALINYAQSLEKSLSSYIPQYCQDRNIPIPKERTLERAKLLLQLNAEMGALQVKGREIAFQGERLVTEQVRIQAETARNGMLARELPAAVEAAKEANVAKEAEIAEKARHLLAQISGAISSSLIGAYNGLIGGLVNSVSAVVRENPKVAFPVGVTLAALIIQIINAEAISFSSLEIFVFKSGLAGLVTAVAVGVGAGLGGLLGRRGNTP